MTADLEPTDRPATDSHAAESAQLRNSSHHRIEHGKSGLAKNFRRVGRAALFILVVVALVYWSRFRPVEVRAHTIRRGDIKAEVMGTGTLEARVKAVISPKISGRVSKVLADQGDETVANQPLVMLDDEELQQQVEIAIASVEAAQAALDRLKADKDRAVAVIAQAEFDYNRTKGLYEKNTATSVEIQKATEALHIARAELARAEAAIVEGQKDVIAEQKTLAYHRARLSDTEIKAPFDGMIVKRYRDAGDVVVPGSPVLTLISKDEIWISAWVDETQMAKLRPDQPARVVFRSAPDHAYPGNVARLGREADRETREFIVDVRVLDLPENWAVGQRAEVYIQTASKDDIVCLPPEFLDRREDRSGVFVVQDGRATWRSVGVGLMGRQILEVLHGLESGEKVLVPTDNQISLRDGQRITIEP